MSKTFFRYFGVSLERKRKKDIAIGAAIINDKIVYCGLIFNFIYWNFGLWVHRRGYVASCSANCV